MADICAPTARPPSSRRRAEHRFAIAPAQAWFDDQLVEKLLTQDQSILTAPPQLAQISVEWV